jgi:single-strand DNA-binding protein
MGSPNINRVVLLGNLIIDPRLRKTKAGTPVCKLRLACSTRRRDGQTGEWIDNPSYFDITVWGSQGENVARHLQKGQPVAVDGRLQWRQWETDDGSQRQAIEVVADSVQFLAPRNPDTRSVDYNREELQEVAS